VYHHINHHVHEVGDDDNLDTALELLIEAENNHVNHHVHKVGDDDNLDTTLEI
jgi:hypothetical protein